MKTLMRPLFLLLLIICQPVLASDCVVILHGLGRTAQSMQPIATALSNAGFLVVNHSYPSREKSINELSSAVQAGIDACRTSNAKQIHFVTHSLGGILVRQYFQTHTVPEAKRVVMLAPPNHGSEIADRHKNRGWYQLFTGPAGQELGTEATSTPNQLKPIPLEIGIIAGTESLDPWFAGIMPAPHDGKVSVASTKLAEMKDFITVPHSHTFIANSDLTIAQIHAFLSRGSFNKVQ